MNSIGIIQQYPSGNHAASEELVAALRPRLARMAAWYARQCREDADDLLQEAWTGLLEALPNLDPSIGDPRQYLLRYARWRMLDAIKRARVRWCTLLADEELEPLLMPAHDEALDRACLMAFMQQLSPTQRHVLHCLLRGCTWREAGDALGCTSANIAWHVRQIRQKFLRWQEYETGPLAHEA